MARILLILLVFSMDVLSQDFQADEEFVDNWFETFIASESDGLDGFSETRISLCEPPPAIYGPGAFYEFKDKKEFAYAYLMHCRMVFIKRGIHVVPPLIKWAQHEKGIIRKIAMDALVNIINEVEDVGKRGLYGDPGTCSRSYIATLQQAYEYAKVKNLNISKTDISSIENKIFLSPDESLFVGYGKYKDKRYYDLLMTNLYQLFTNKLPRLVYELDNIGEHDLAIKVADAAGSLCTANFEILDEMKIWFEDSIFILAVEGADHSNIENFHRKKEQFYRTVSDVKRSLNGMLDFEKEKGIMFKRKSNNSIQIRNQ